VRRCRRGRCGWGFRFFVVPAKAGVCAIPMPGVARRQVTFFCFAKRKYPKKRRPQVRRRYAVPSAAHKRGPLRNSWLVGASRKRFCLCSPLKQSSRTSPAFAALLGDSHGAPVISRRPRIRVDVVPAKAGTQVQQRQSWPLPSSTTTVSLIRPPHAPAYPHDTKTAPSARKRHA
jgi:hypothetical protein